MPAATQKWTDERSAAGKHNPWLIVAIISMATFMEVLDTSIANVSLNHIAGGLSATTDEAAWVLTSYLVSNAIVIPISDRHLEYARRVHADLVNGGLRVDLDERQEKIGYKIREAQLQKIPYMLVVGDREAAEGTVSVRTRTGGDQGAASVTAFLDAARAEVASRGRNVAGAATAGASA